MLFVCMAAILGARRQNAVLKSGVSWLETQCQGSVHSAHASQPWGLLPFIPALDQALEGVAVPAATRTGSRHSGSSVHMQSSLGSAVPSSGVGHFMAEILHIAHTSWAHLQ